MDTPKVISDDSRTAPTDEAVPTCGRCGEPMPPGEEMFAYHGYSGPCPKPSLLKRPKLDPASFVVVPDRPSSPSVSVPAGLKGRCGECGCQTGGGGFCFQHAPYMVYPQADGSYLVDRNGRKRVSFDEPPAAPDVVSVVREMREAAKYAPRKATAALYLDWADRLSPPGAERLDGTVTELKAGQSDAR